MSMDYTTSEAAEMLGVSTARIRQMILKGDIKANKRGRDNFITKEEVEKAARRNTKPGPTTKQSQPETVAA